MALLSRCNSYQEEFTMTTNPHWRHLWSLQAVIGMCFTCFLVLLWFIGYLGFHSCILVLPNSNLFVASTIPWLKFQQSTHKKEENENFIRVLQTHKQRDQATALRAHYNFFLSHIIHLSPFIGWSYKSCNYCHDSLFRNRKF